MAPDKVVTVFEPEVPVAGLRLRVGAGETVNDVAAAFPELSSAETLWLPLVDVGTSKVTPAGIAPPPVAVITAGVVVTWVPS